MNNPGIDLKIWEQLKKKWDALNAGGHNVRIEFKLITDPNDENKVLLIDVIQNIDNEIITETVQKTAREAYAILGVDGLSMERLVAACKEKMKKSHQQAGGKRESIFTVTMSPSSPTSGELRGILEEKDTDIQTSVLVNYIHYYILNALREKMVEVVGDSWKKVKAVYQSEELEFYFEY
jgi:hypothetical protein